MDQSWPEDVRKWWNERTPLEKGVIILVAVMCVVSIVYLIKWLMVCGLAAIGAWFRRGTAQAAPGAAARCSDDWMSRSCHRQGTCSHHGGVDNWLNGSSPSAA